MELLKTLGCWEKGWLLQGKATSSSSWLGRGLEGAVAPPASLALRSSTQRGAVCKPGAQTKPPRRRRHGLAQEKLEDGSPGAG